MSRIVHIALKLDDIEKVSEFYEQVFGFIHTQTNRVRDHTARHLTDGTVDLALIKYDSEESSAEASASGPGPCLHHFAIEVDDMGRYIEEIRKRGCEIIGDPGGRSVKFRAPGGTVGEIVPLNRYKTKKE